MDIKNIYNKIDKILKNEDEHTKETLEEIKRQLEVEIITGGKTNNNITSAFKRLVKDNEIRPRFQNVLINNDNKYTITNGYFLITYNQEQLPDQLKPFIDKTNDNMYNDFNYDKFKNTNEVVKISINWDLFTKVHKYNKLHKKVRSEFVLSDGFCFNIQYFMDIITLLGYKDISKDIELEYYPENHTTPMNIKSKNGNAILLPIRCTDEQITNALELQNKILNNMEV